MAGRFKRGKEDQIAFILCYDPDDYPEKQLNDAVVLAVALGRGTFVYTEEPRRI